MASWNFRRVVVIAGVAGYALSYQARGQSPATFEVAAIRRNLSSGQNTNIKISGGRFTVTNGSLKTLIRNAYDILSFQLAGGPSWLDTDMYDIVATTGSRENISPDQLKLLLKSLLSDRFQLKVHWETREARIYALLPAKDGPRFKESSDAQEPGINTQKRSGRAQMKGTKEPMSILASNLGNQLGRIVADKTGAHGVYDWMLEWDPDPTADATLPSLFTALQQQLGLRLEAQRGPVQILVIESAEKASDN